MTGKILIILCVAFVLLFTFALCKVSSRCSREEEKRDEQREDG
jgi:hypothetical protein